MTVPVIFVVMMIVIVAAEMKALFTQECPERKGSKNQEEGS